MATDPGITTPTPRAKTVLFVEDNAELRDLIDLLLSRSGYRVMASSNPVAAMTRAESQPDEIDVVLTDMVMPEMSGLELAERLAVLNPALRVLIMSGNAYRPAELATRSGARAEFIQKPFMAEELLGKLKQVLESSR